jgi:3-phosphoglycerate kinase
MEKMDAILIGGGMAFSFLKAQGKEIGASLFEPETLDTARDVLEQTAKSKKKFLLPSDCVIAEKMDANAMTRMAPSGSIPAGWMGLDIGPESIRQFENEINAARTILWNGPVGVFEMQPFEKGTRSIAELLAKRTAAGAITVLGGGETAAAADAFGVADKMTHISTGGGASLEFIEGRVLPGIAALDDAA